MRRWFIDTAIVRNVVALPVMPLGQHGDFARRHFGANDSAATPALLATLATDQPAPGIEAIAVRSAAIGAESADGTLGVQF
jgi:hypothetical protein